MHEDVPIVVSIGLTICIFFYYSNIHLAQMDPYPIKLVGVEAFFASALLGSSLGVALSSVERSFPLAVTHFQMSLQKSILTIVAFLLIPVALFGFVPIPMALAVVGNVSLLWFLLPTYVMVCLAISARSKALFIASLFAKYISLALFSGIYYI